VCRCPQELLRENRMHGVACPERAQTVSETLEEWERMLANAYNPGEAVLRLRTDLNDPDPAFRDRVLFRISDIDHPRVGRKYRVWPLLEFSWAVDDIELGVTHVLRGKDLVMEDRMELYLWNLLGIQGPPFLHWGILRVREAKVAKSKSYREVKSGIYDGWADPRTWSLRSLDRRGISMETLREFTLSFGLSLADIEVPAETL
jgi:glutamyl-tRNA synthetase